MASNFNAPCKGAFSENSPTQGRIPPRQNSTKLKSLKITCPIGFYSKKACILSRFCNTVCKKRTFCGKNAAFFGILIKMRFLHYVYQKTAKNHFLQHSFHARKCNCSPSFWMAPNCAKLTKPSPSNFKHLYNIGTVRAQKRAFREKTLAKKVYL